MRIFDDIGLIDLAIHTDRALVVTDFHIGYEGALNKQGLMVPRFQFLEIMKRLEKIFSRLKNKKVERIIVNGDLKHEFGNISEQEWRHTLQLLDFFEKHCNEIILIKGNHDTILGPIAKKRNVKVLDSYIIESMEKSAIIKKTNEKIKNNDSKNRSTIKKINIKNQIEKTIKNKIMINNKNSKNKILIIHGDEIPEKNLLKDVSTIIIGHEHPAVSIKEGPRRELFKAYLIGKWKGKNLIVQPSFNLVVEGTDVLKEEVLSQFLKNNLRNFDAVVAADKLYKFGKLKDL